MEMINFNRDWYYYPAKNGLFGEMGEEPRKVMLPHDAIINKNREANAESGSAKGFYPNGSYVYKKNFALSRDWEGKVIRFLFEGVYMNGTVWLNGEYAGKCQNGYREFIIDADHLLKYGEENEIKITLRTGEDSRWYSGAGIYRDVHMLVGGPVHIAPYGIRLATESADETTACVSAELAIENHSRRRRNLKVEIELRDSTGKIAAKTRKVITLYGSMGGETLTSRLYIESPRLWSCETPELYECTATLSEGDEVLDSTTTAFGIRTLSLDPANGLRINGRTVKLFGGCIHHDNGILGSATIARAEERRVEFLKAAGYNAIRMAHHPASRALLEACDKTGMVVMDELGDMWNVPKSTEDYSFGFDSDYADDIESMVNKDYNHPSVIMYSIGNEIPEMGKPSGGVLARELARETRRRDGTRYITSGVNGMVSNMEVVFQRMAQAAEEAGVDAMNGIISELGSKMKEIQCEDFIVDSTREAMEALDIAGYNYAEDRYLQDAAEFDNWISVGSETFPKDLAKNWKLTMENSHVIGDFSWTSWDYLGEAGIGRNVYDSSLETGGISAAFPYFIAFCGDFDITGGRRPQSYYREIVVGHREQPYIAVQKPEHYGRKSFNTAWSWSDSLSSWNWKGYENRPVKVEVYAMADEVELLINGESAGKLPVPGETTEEEMAYCTVFDTVYRPGKAEAVTYRDGKEAGRYVLETAGDAVGIEVSADKEAIRADEKSLSYLKIRFVDEKGRTNSDVSSRVTVEVEGSGILQGLGSADPVSRDNFTEESYSPWFGELLAAVRPTEEGTIAVKVKADGFETVQKTIKVS